MTTIDKTLTSRQSLYGDFSGSARVSCKLKAVINKELKKANKALDFDQAEALAMICSKISRIINGDPDCIDSWHDIAGYATLVERRLQADLEELL